MTRGRPPVLRQRVIDVLETCSPGWFTCRQLADEIADRFGCTYKPESVLRELRRRPGPWMLRVESNGFGYRWVEARWDSERNE